MSVRISARIHRGATVLALSGAVDSLDPVRDAAVPLLRTPGLVVVDIDSLTAVDTRRLRELIVRLLDVGGDPQRLRFVVRRNSLLELLTRARVHHLVSLHPTVDDAIGVHYASRRDSGGRRRWTAHGEFGIPLVQSRGTPLRRRQLGGQA